MPDYYYSQPIESDVEIFVVDTEKFNTQESEWLTKKLTESEARWKIVVGHRPLVSYETTKNLENWNGKAQLLNIICSKADLYISGHAHVMEQNTIPNCKALQVVSGGGGASLRDFVSGNNSVFSSSIHGFFSTNFEDGKLNGEFTDTNGKVIHSFNLN
jgi:tartrate-resistant acid phosphatase type 5